MSGFMDLLMVFLGGGLGSVCRYGLKIFSDKNISMVYPIGTFAANILGSLFLGFIVALILNKTTALSDNSKLFLTVGFAGGFTTFSTFCFEITTFIKEGNFLIGFSYALLSVILGISAVFLGIYLARYI